MEDKLNQILAYSLLAAKKVLTLEDVSLLTGLSKSYLYRLSCTHQIPYYKPNGKQIYFDRAEIESWMKQNRVATKQEAEQAAIAYVVTDKQKTMDEIVGRDAGNNVTRRKGGKEMTLNEYQNKALETAQYPKEHKIIYPTLGLTGEAGEVSDKVKKVLRDFNGDFSESIRYELAKELGDVLWYIATLSRDLGYTLEEIGEMNNAKLASRKQRGMISGNGDNR